VNNFYHTDNKSALEAITEAHRIAFAPFLFQATVALDNLGILAAVDQSRKHGISINEIAKQRNLSHYGCSILLDAGLSIGLFYQKENLFHLSKTGHFLLHDKMTRVNFEFSRDFCYRGLEQLQKSIETGKPEGLKSFSDSATLYPALSTLPEPAKSSWFNFDHFFSDTAFPEALPIVFDRPIKHLLDCGGNTGKWSLQCVQYNDDVKVTIIDLPQQLKLMQKNIAGKKGAERIQGQPLDFLKLDTELPKNPDVIWMSQFLDCFSEGQIRSIINKTIAAMGSNTRLCILETFWDQQAFEAGALSLNCTSLYFSCFANGDSRMYRAQVFKDLLLQAGLSIVSEHPQLGRSHTLLICELARH